MKYLISFAIFLCLTAGTLESAQSNTKVFDSYRLDSKHSDDINYPVVGIGERTPLILKNGQVIEGGRHFIRLKPKTQVNDESIEVLSMDQKRNEKAIIIKATLKSSVPMERPFALVIYEVPGKGDMRCKFSKLPKMTGEPQQVTMRFNANGVPEKGWTLRFFNGQDEVYTDQIPDLRDAKPIEAFVLHLGRHMNKVGLGDAGPAPYYVPVSKPGPELLPEGDEPVMIRVKMTIKEDGRVGEFSFPDELDAELEKHISTSIRQWLLFPRIKNGQRLETTVVFPLQLR
ncbi:MAG: hypothetical protein AB3N64_10745 [Puniceicoccaceae bacterium]